MYKDFYSSLFMYKVQEKGEKSEAADGLNQWRQWWKKWSIRNKAYYYPYENCESMKLIYSSC